MGSGAGKTRSDVDEFRYKPSMERFFEKTMSQDRFEPPVWHPGSPKGTDLSKYADDLLVTSVDSPRSVAATPSPGSSRPQGPQIGNNDVSRGGSLRHSGQNASSMRDRGNRRATPP
eukprot:CAMPEP_0176221684 /NCGR_PEP_ID=MMETSP0121_2-20121125/19851_1 /TAXON_ID=160619 /ORGANISM="Kryptoperidinium foliaceum, Strain CCMP 1326" /LENGTH=115 /DNA_ID=CAMNT_0017560885 /DNA_START=68 /DNA_END=415 /DNA_ORIENTATION=-